MLMLFQNRVYIRAHYSKIVYKHQKLQINKKSLPCHLDQIKFEREGEQASQLVNEGSIYGIKEGKGTKNLV